MLPGVHRVASLAKRWLLSTHQGAVDIEHLPGYLKTVSASGSTVAVHAAAAWSSCDYSNSPSVTTRSATGKLIKRHQPRKAPPRPPGATGHPPNMTGPALPAPGDGMTSTTPVSGEPYTAAHRPSPRCPSEEGRWGANIHGRDVIVGPPHLAQPAKPGRPAVSAVLEDPPYGGPVAGLAAGLAAIPKPERAPLIALLACDAPRAGRAIPSLLKALERVPDSDGARLVDADGNRQNLLAVYRAASLQGAVASADRRGGVRGMSMRALVAHLRLLDVPDCDDLGFDADTWEAVEVLDRDFREEDR